MAGCLPGLTVHLDRLEAGGWESGALLLGILRVSVIGTLTHLSMAGPGLLASRDEEMATGYLVWGGVAYAVLSFHRLLVDLVLAGVLTRRRSWTPAG